MCMINDRERQAFSDQAKTLQVVAIKLGLKPGPDAIRTVPETVLALIAERDNITQHAVHAARCQLIQEIEELFGNSERLTAGQVIDLLSVEKEVAA